MTLTAQQVIEYQKARKRRQKIEKDHPDLFEATLERARLSMENYVCFKCGRDLSHQKEDNDDGGVWGNEMSQGPKVGIRLCEGCDVEFRAMAKKIGIERIGDARDYQEDA